MAGKVLLVIDMLKDFLEPQGALTCGEAARAIIPFVADKVREFTGQNLPVILIMDSHDPEDPEFKRFPLHCVYGTPGAELIAELQALVEEYPFTIKVPKTRFSGFFRTNLNTILSDLAPAEVHVTGVCTNICVLYTVEELANRDYRTIVYRDGVAGFDREAHLWALEQMKSVLGAEVR